MFQTLVVTLVVSQLDYDKIVLVGQPDSLGRSWAASRFPDSFVGFVDLCRRLCSRRWS
jgi:hypothetical protein